MGHTLRLLLILLLTAAVLVASSARVSVVAQSQPNTGAFVWYDLVTTQAPEARTFYGELFGWTFEETKRNSRPYVIARVDGRPIAGIVGVEAGPGVGSQWLSYVLVDDVEHAVEMAKSAGGDVLVPPTKVASGLAAVVRDPLGAPVGLGRVTLEVPAIETAELGQFFWADYMATDSRRALEFYQRIAGYEVDDPTAIAGGMHVVLRTGHPRAGLFALPEGTDHIRSHWLPHVRVADPAAAAARATELGGSVLLAPSPDIRHNTLAIIADPAGAAIALQKWPIEEP